MKEYFNLWNIPPYEEIKDYLAAQMLTAKNQLDINEREFQR